MTCVLSPSPVPPPSCLSLSNPMHYLVSDELESVSETVPLLSWLCFPSLSAPLRPNTHFTRPSRLGSRSLPCCLSGFVNDETFSSRYSGLSLELEGRRLPIGFWGMPKRYIRFKIFDHNSSSEGSARVMRAERRGPLNNPRSNKNRGLPNVSLRGQDID